MRSASAYTSMQGVTMDGNRAFEELYVRLARWTAEAAELEDPKRYEQLIDKCVSLLGYMDPVIDPSTGREVALKVLSLNRFAINTLIKAKQPSGPPEVVGLAPVFYAMADIFKTIAEAAERAFAGDAKAS